MGAGDPASSVLRHGAFLALCLFLSAAASAQASAATYYVATTGNDAAAGREAFLAQRALLIGAETGNRINKQRLNSANGMMPLQ